MQVFAIIIIVFGVVGTIASLYARFTVKSPILSTKDGKEVVIGAISIQQILNIIFVYFAILHLMFIFIGLNFLIG